MQSAGKSSALEAITEIPFPRSDNTCTEFATEIVLERGPVESLTVGILPDLIRTSDEKTPIREFEESNTDLSKLGDLTFTKRLSLKFRSRCRTVRKIIYILLS